jgi:hypothetical protein
MRKMLADAPLTIRGGGAFDDYAKGNGDGDRQSGRKK